MERAQCAAPAQRDDRGGGRHRGVFPLRSLARRDRRGSSRRCRLSHRRDEASRRAGHRRGQGIDARSFHTETVAVPPPVIYYVRHGLTDWNAEHRLQGRHDIPLNREGCAQAVRCADILQDLFRRDGRPPESFDYVSSPLIRARKTMEIMRATLGLPPNAYSVDQRLAEIAFGDWEGLTYVELMARDTEAD